MALQIRRGTEADRTTITPAVGEPIYTTDNKELFIGDGTTPGGVAVGGGGTLTVDTQDFTASGTWTKPANAVWVEVTMCGGGVGGEAGSDTLSGYGGAAGRPANKTFLASALGSTVSVTCGAAVVTGNQPSSSNSSSFGTYLYAAGGGGSGSDYPTLSRSGNIGDNEIGSRRFGEGGGELSNGVYGGGHGFAFGPGGGGSGGSNSITGQAAGWAGGLAASGRADDSNVNVEGGGAGGASGATGSAGTAGGYDTITGFGNGGGGGGEGTAGAGGAGGAAVRGGGGGGGGMGTTAGGAGGAGGAGFVRVRTLCFG